MARKRLALLALLCLGCVLAYMTLGARGSWSFILPFRGTKLMALLMVAAAVSTSTVLFQTISQNRLLTPSFMGFDALYLLIVTVSVFVLGGPGFAAIPPLVLFLLNVALLTGAALLLFTTLLRSAQNDLMRLILTGIICAALFRAISSLLVRMIDPNEFAAIQVDSFARFSRVEVDMLVPAALLFLPTMAITWHMRHRLDVLALGHDTAINLGENPRRKQIRVLILVAVLVSVSTALVGPVVFLGLLVVSLAHLILPTAHHAVLLPSSALISAILLIGGQALMERVLAYTTPLSVVIECLGGIVFLVLLLRGIRR